MLLSGIEKELSILGGGDQVAGRIEIAFAAKIGSASIPCTSKLGGEGGGGPRDIAASKAIGTQSLTDGTLCLRSCGK